MDEIQFKTIVALLMIVVCILAVVSVILAVTYAVLANRMSNRIRRTVSGMESLLAESIAEAGRREELQLIPPMRIELKESDETLTSELALRTHAWLLKHNFEHAGTFRVDYDEELLQTYLSSDRRIVSAIRKSEAAPYCYVEFAMDLGKGECAGVSNPPASSAPPQGESVGKFFAGSLTDDFDLLERMFAEASRIAATNEVREIRRERVATFFEEAHASQMDWRIRNGGISEGEITQAFSAQGAVCSPAEVAAIRLRWQRAIDRHILTYSRCGASDANFEADHLIVVHDSSLPEHLQNRLQTAVLQDPSVHTDRTCRALTTSTLTELDQLLDRFSPREAIARLRPLVGDELQLILEEQLSVPVGADIYRISAS